MKRRPCMRNDFIIVDTIRFGTISICEQLPNQILLGRFGLCKYVVAVNFSGHFKHTGFPGSCNEDTTENCLSICHTVAGAYVFKKVLLSEPTKVFQLPGD